jgi:glutathione S-transferase
MEYVGVADAIDAKGLRLVLTAGVPGPWGESAKAIFHVKGIHYTPVRQDGGSENTELEQWTGRSNAPIAIYNDEAGRDGWADILGLAERLNPTPTLIPDDFERRVRMFGLCREICGPGGFGWHRRTQLLAPILAADVPDSVKEMPRRLAGRYAFSPDQVAGADARVVEILSGLSAQLVAQRGAGSRYFIGDGLSAVDVYWACFAAMLEPLAPESCAMPDMLRRAYTLQDPTALAAADPILLEHRDFIYATHLELPLDF